MKMVIRDPRIEAAGRPRVDLDTVLTQEVGQFGRYQLRSAVFILCASAFAAISGNSYVFTAARINTRCLIPECDQSKPEFSPSWILNAVPGTSSSTFDNCQRYVNATNEFNNETCPASRFDRENIQNCDEYVYETENTVVYDFGLACNEWKRTLIGTAQTIGNLATLPLTGFVSDRWGRKTALTMTAFNAAWLGSMKQFVNNYWGMVVLEFLEATFSSGAYSGAYILLTEIVGPKYRGFITSMTGISFSLGLMYMGSMASLVNYWKNLIRTLYTPMFLTISYLWILDESARWLISKGRYEDSEKVLQKMAKANRKELSQKSLELLRLTAEEEKSQKILNEAELQSEPWLLILVFRHKPVLITCLVSPIWWITMTLVYYGISINAVNLSGNAYVNYIAVTSVEIPGYLTAIFLVSKFGRKPILIGAYWMCSLCFVVFILVPDDMPDLSLTLFLVGKFSIAIVVTALYVYTAELYPTRYRHSLFAFSSMLGRIGSITAPLTPALSETVWVHLPFTLFAVCSFVSGLLVFLMPETRGARLPDTMEEAAAMTTRKNVVL